MEKLDKITKKIRKCAKEGKVRLAPQDECERLAPILNEFVSKVLGHPEALYTDLCYITDFRDERSRHQYKKDVVTKTKKVFGVDISGVYYEYLPIVGYVIEFNREMMKRFKK